MAIGVNRLCLIASRIAATQQGRLSRWAGAGGITSSRWRDALVRNRDRSPSFRSRRCASM